MKKCGKVMYSDEKTANAALERIQKVSTREKKPRKSYFCSQCKCWHLTSQITRKSLMNENAILTTDNHLLEQKIQELEKQISFLTDFESLEEKKKAAIIRKNNELFIQLKNKVAKQNLLIKKLRYSNSNYLSKLLAKK